MRSCLACSPVVGGLLFFMARLRLFYSLCLYLLQPWSLPWLFYSSVGVVAPRHQLGWAFWYSYYFYLTFWFNILLISACVLWVVWMRVLYENVRVFKLSLPAGCCDMSLWWWLLKRKFPLHSYCVYKYANCSAWFIHAYGEGLTGAHAAWANKRYHSHCTLPSDMIREVKNSILLWGNYYFTSNLSICLAYQLCSKILFWDVFCLIM